MSSLWITNLLPESLHIETFRGQLHYEFDSLFDRYPQVPENLWKQVVRESLRARHIRKVNNKRWSTFVREHYTKIKLKLGDDTKRVVVLKHLSEMYQEQNNT